MSLAIRLFYLLKPRMDTDIIELFSSTPAWDFEVQI